MKCYHDTKSRNEVQTCFGSKTATKLGLSPFHRKEPPTKTTNPNGQLGLVQLPVSQTQRTVTCPVK